MAAPADTTIKNLNGSWVMVRLLSKEKTSSTSEIEPRELTIDLCNRTLPCPTLLIPSWLWYEPNTSLPLPFHVSVVVQAPWIHILTATPQSNH
jgi:hypothetical protein